ncbi:unnamed protein product [Phytophthora lilii]|uniref:Unnamed protein product n=1 Tax=Phytophthora lilii TaxID=2077276 RepID=A0A9W6TEG1_9STRA|nr:unnamed protein product [Phytophthora lilii]
MRVQRQKWLKEVEEQQAADGRFVKDMDNFEVQDEELAKYMKRKNLTVQLCTGGARNLFDTKFVYLMICSLMTMWFLLYFQPYDGYSDNLIASITQLQLFFTLWLGVMIRLNDLNTESLINVQLLSFLLVGTCIAVTIFGLSMIVVEGLAESQRIFAETTAQRKKQLQEEVRKRWFKAFNYAAYEAQMLRFGGQLSFTHFSVAAMLEAFRRGRLLDDNPGVDIAMPKIAEEEMEPSSTDLRHPDASTQIHSYNEHESFGVEVDRNGEIGDNETQEMAQTVRFRGRRQE